ncbi:MAG: cysteine peptidase family C39 domain-containing protein [Deltaproteobacteria bacterium]|nr:cysteine peptidase family C39 domain-containing protein [Deltaproteobacteria bacterium]
MMRKKNRPSTKNSRKSDAFAFIGLLVILALLLTGAAMAGSLPQVRPNLTSLELSRPPTDEELMAAGQLGGQLFPTADLATEEGVPARSARRGALSRRVTQALKDHHHRINLSFGKAIQEWNSHHYVKAVEMLKSHIAEYPDSPWASEALLHLGCDAFYHKRSTEAEDYFRTIIERNKNNPHVGAKILINKARLRLGVLKAARNNTTEAAKLFALLVREGTDWREKTYASQWLQRLATIRNAGTRSLSCGAQALSYFFKASGIKEADDDLEKKRPETTSGFSFADLTALAAEQGTTLAALRLTPEDLPRLKLPALVHIAGRDPGDSGHYWVLERIDGDRLSLFDPQAENYFVQTTAEFAAEWSGATLVRENKDQPLAGVRLAKAELTGIVGGCCGVPRGESGLGGEREEEGLRVIGWQQGRKAAEDCCNTESPRGAPGWRINPVNMNLFVQDVPLSYWPTVGPPVKIALSYNSQSAIAIHEPFGAKWQFNYGSYLVMDTNGEVTVFMPDGRRDVYAPQPSGGYISPYKVHNTLVKLAENRFELRFPHGTVYLYDIPAGTGSLQPFLTEIRDPYGQKLTIGYDSQVRLATITDADGKITTLSYDGSNLITKVTDPFGRSAAFEYGTDNTLAKITDMGGYASTLTYDAVVSLTSIGVGANSWQFDIEPADGIGNGADPYPPPGGVMWENYRITVTNPMSGKEEFYYDGYSSTGWHVQPRDYVEYYPGYDGADTPKTEIRFMTTTGLRAEVYRIVTPAGDSYVYDYNVATGDLLSNWDGTTYTRNSQGMPTSVTDPLGTVTTATYAPNGVDMTGITNGLGTVSLTYNGNHDQISVTDRLGHKTSYTYNAMGQPTGITDPLGTVTSYVYDANRRLVSITTDGITTDTLTYDTFGRVRTLTDRTGITRTYDYNNLDDVTRKTYPDGTFISVAYSPDTPHLVTAVTDRAGATIAYGYDGLNRLIRETLPDGGTVTYSRDDNGNVTGITDPGGNTKRIVYDLNNRPVQDIYPDNTSLQRTFGWANQLEQISQEGGSGANFQYDASFNLTYIGGFTSDIHALFTYDAYKRCTSMSDSRGQTLYGYDANTRLTTIDGPLDSDTITLSYDAAERRTGISVDGGLSLTYTYDQLGRVTGIGTGSGNGYGFQYTGASPLPTGISRPSGSVTSFIRDVMGRPTQVETRSSSNALINSFAYTYTASRDLPSSESVTSGAAPASLPSTLFSFTYDSKDLLTGSSPPALSYTHDARGNLTGGYAADGSPFTAVYDDMNRLISIEFTDKGGVLRRSEYIYDGYGRPAGETDYADGTITRQASFLTLGSQLLQERDGNGVPVRDYTWSESAATERHTLLGLRQGGQNYSYLLDGQGRVNALLTDGQAVAAAYSFDPFGIPTATPGSLDQPFRTSNAAFDERAGLYLSDSGFYLPGPGVQLSRKITMCPKGLNSGVQFRPMGDLLMRLTGGVQ